MKSIQSIQAQPHSVNALKNHQRNALAKANEAADIVKEDKVIAQENSFLSIKRQHDNLILKSSLQVSVNSGNQPLELLYRTAIDSINLVLEEQFGENTIQNSYQSGLDISPQATANRIVAMSTAFFSQYKDQNLESSDQQAMDSFIDIIRGGIDSGFSEAKDILQGLDVLDGDIASNIELAYAFVQHGLNDFIAEFSDKSNAI